MLEIEIFLIKPAHDLNYIAVLNERNEINFLGKHVASKSLNCLATSYVFLGAQNLDIF